MKHMATPSSEPSSGTPTSPETPEQLKSRIGKLLADFAAAGHAVGLGHVAGLFMDGRKRVREANRALARAAGMEDIIDATPGEDMNINIGDVHHALPPTAPPSPAWPMLLTAAGLLALGGVGGAGLLLLMRPSVQQPTVTTPTPAPTATVQPGPQPSAQQPVAPTGPAPIIQKTEGFLLELMDGKK